VKVISIEPFFTKDCVHVVEVPVLSRSGNKVRFINQDAALSMMWTTTKGAATFFAHDDLD
jgi:hypothetical protein